MKSIISRLAKKPISIPKGVEVKVEDTKVIVKGPKGELEKKISPYVILEIKDDQVFIKPNEAMLRRKSDAKTLRINTGTYWSHVRNMIKGVTEGYSKELQIVGIGYRAQLQGSKLVLNLGYSNPIVVEPPEGISFEVPEPTRIIVKGMDKEKVGQVAANIKAYRKPNVYSGKGIRYKGEVIRTKVGKKV